PYTLSGFGSLTVEPEQGQGTIKVVKGSHTIATQVYAATPLNLDVAEGSTLTLANGLSASATTVTKSGAGTAAIGAWSSWTSLVLTEGTLRTDAPQVLPSNADIGGAAGRLDLNGFDQEVSRLLGTPEITNSSATPATLTIRPMADGLFNGLI